MIKNTAKKELIINREFLTDAIYLVKEYYRVDTTYRQMAHIINVEFECNCTENDIENHYIDNRFDLDSNIDEKMIYKNVR
jgi:hypothetical protein